MIAKFNTACGASQHIRVHSLTPIYKLPISFPHTGIPPVTRYREFEFIEMDEDGVAQYREVLE